MKWILLLTLLQPVPLPEIDGPVEVQPGYLTVLRPPAGAESPQWLLVEPPSDDNHQVGPDGTLYFATAQPGTYHFVLAYLSEGQQLRQLQHVLRVGARGPPEPLPYGRYGLTRRALDAARGLQLSRGPASAIAEVYETVADELSAGTLTAGEPGTGYGDAIFRRTGEVLGEALTASERTEWTPWGKAINQALQTLYSDDRITSDADWSAAHREIAVGVAAYGGETPEPAGKLAWVITIEETSERSTEVAAVVNDVTWWESLTGVQRRSYDADSDAAKQYADLWRGKDLPIGLLVDADGYLISTVPIETRQQFQRAVEAVHRGGGER